MNRWLLLLFTFQFHPSWAVTPQEADRFTQIAGVKLSDNPSLGSLQKKFGVSPIKETGDAGDYDARICYQSADKKSIVEFFHGEVNWGFVIRVVAIDDEKCPVSKSLTNLVLNVHGIKLQMTMRQLTQYLGAAKRSNDSMSYHDFSYVRTLDDKELHAMIEQEASNGSRVDNPEVLRHWDVDMSFDSKFDNGRLVSFTVNREATN